MTIALGTLSVALISCAPSSASPSPTEAGILPGRPYDAAEVLAAMRDSRRPGGVPDQLETDATASDLAEALWTWDGAPWDDLSMGGACGPSACSLDVAGSPGNGAGTDLYSFTIDPTTGLVALVATDLHGFPVALESELDAVARAALPAGQVDGLQLAGMRWLPPPDDGRYWLAYRSGGEEGSPGVDVLVVRDGGEIVQVIPVS